MKLKIKNLIYYLMIMEYVIFSMSNIYFGQVRIYLFTVGSAAALHGLFTNPFTRKNKRNKNK